MLKSHRDELRCIHATGHHDDGPFARTHDVIVHAVGRRLTSNEGLCAMNAQEPLIVSWIITISLHSLL